MIFDRPSLRVKRRPGGVLTVKVGLITLLLCTAIMLHDLRPAASTPLNSNDCLGYWNDREDARGKGVEKLMSQGPAAALSTMTKAQLQLIRSYLTLSGKLKFRCRGFTPTPRPNPRR